MLSFKRDPKWGYLIAGVSLLIFALILYLAPYMPHTFIFEKYKKEGFMYLSIIGGITLIALWLALRSFALELFSFGYKAKFVSRREKNLKELFNILENSQISKF